MKLCVAVCALVLAGSVSSEAMACMPPPPPPPEAAAQMEMDREADLMSRSTVIYIAWISRKAPSRRVLRGAEEPFDDVTLRPIAALKGELPTNSLTLRVLRMDSCGALPSLDALWGEVGERFVVFATSARPSQGTILDTIPLDEITHPALLDLMPPPPPAGGGRTVI